MSQHNKRRTWIVQLIDGRCRVYDAHTPMDARRQAWRDYGRGCVTRIERY